MYLKKKTRDLDREVQISNTETDKRATAASKAPKELDISKTEANFPPFLIFSHSTCTQYAQHTQNPTIDPL